MSAQNTRVARNIVGTLVTQLLTWGVAVVVTLFLPRYLKDEGMGKLGIVTALTSVIGVLVPLGTSQVLVKEIARDRSKTGSLLAAGFVLRLLLGVLAIPLACLVGWGMHYTPERQLLLLVAIPGMVIFVLNDVFASVYQGREELARYNRATLIDKVVYGAAVIALVVAKAPLWAILGVATLTGLVTFGYYLAGMTSLLKTLRWPHWSELKSLALSSLPFMGVKVFQTLYGQTDPIVLGALATDQEAGWYTVAFRLIGTAMFFPMAIVFALLPTLARLHGEGDSAGFASLARRALDITLLVGLPIAAAAVFLPGQIIGVLYDPTFAPAAPVLAVGGVGMLLYFVTAVLGTLVIAMDRQAVQAKGSIIACLFGIPLCALGTWAGHRFVGNGALGAMLTDVVVEIYLAVVYYKALPRQLFDGSTVSRLGRYGLAALPMVLGLYLSLGTSLGLWGALPCAVIYLLGCVLLRCWSVADLKALRGMLTRRAV